MITGAIWRRSRLTAVITAVAAVAVGCSGMSPYKYRNIYTMTEPVVSGDKVYSDGRIKVRFYVDEKRIYMDLTNLTDKPLALDWGKARYAHIDGMKYAVTEIDSMLADRKDKPASATVAPGKTLHDFVAPAKNVEKMEEWTWYIYPLFNLFDDKAYDNRGKTFGLSLPVKADGKWKTYVFRFEISNVVAGDRRA